MCFSFDARPPELPGDLALPPIAGGAGAELLELSSEDGTRFSAALAESAEPRDPGVLIFPDVRGLYPLPHVGRTRVDQVQADAAAALAALGDRTGTASASAWAGCTHSSPGPTRACA